MLRSSEGRGHMTAGITLLTNPQLEDAKLQQLAERAVNVVHLALEKAVAHHAQSELYPISPDPRSLERLCLSYFQTLDPKRQKGAVSKVMSSVRSPQEERLRNFGDLGRVDLRLATSVVEQVKALPLPAELRLTEGEVQKLVNAHGPKDTHTPEAPASSRLECRLTEVKCVRKTRVFGELDFKDEIHLSGATWDGQGAAPIPGVEVGKFGRGDRRVFEQGHRLAYFPLDGASFPRTYGATFALTEADSDDPPSRLSEIGVVVAEIGGLLLLGAVVSGVASFGTQPETVAALAIAGLIAAAVGGALVLLGNIVGNESLPAQTAGLRMDTRSARFAGGKRESGPQIARFSGSNGEYEVTYIWNLA